LLVKYISENKIPTGRALVPGCGRGYDVTALASSNRYALGLDIVPVAVEQARERLLTLSPDQCECKANAEFDTTSFFALNSLNKFDFIYDYTFLCALAPSVRENWAEQMSKLVTPGGELLTLIFPIKESDDGTGPPFGVTLELVRSLLEPRGFECLELEMLPPELCHEGRGAPTPAPTEGTGTGEGTGAGPRKFIGLSGVGRWKKV
jgi:methyl halide transferase